MTIVERGTDLRRCVRCIGMPFMPLEHAPLFLRHAMLGTEAVYEVLEEDAGIVTAQVVSAPGLEPGMRVRLTARAASGMERLDPVPEPEAPRGRFAVALRERATVGAAR